jgi:hypothetical protein
VCIEQNKAMVCVQPKYKFIWLTSEINNYASSYFKCHWSNVFFTVRLCSLTFTKNIRKLLFSPKIINWSCICCRMPREKSWSKPSPVSWTWRKPPNFATRWVLTSRVADLDPYSFPCWFAGSGARSVFGIRSWILVSIFTVRNKE